MDVRQAVVLARCFEALGEEPSVGETVLHYLAVALEAKMDKIVVLHYDLGSWTGEIERVGLLGAAKVVQLEY